MRFGLFTSILLHFAIVGAAFISLPASWRPNVEPEPYIPLELITQAELDLTTSVPAAAPEPEPVEEPEPDLPEPQVEETPAAPEPEPEPAPVEPEPEPAPVVEEPEPEPEPQPEPPKETPAVKPQRTADLDLDALSQLIDKEREDAQSDPRPDTSSQPTESADTARAAVGPGDRLTASDRAKMIAAITQCYTTSALIGAPEPEKLLVILQFDLNRDGTLIGPPRVVNAIEINISGNRFWKVAEQASIRAVVSCQPYDFLDPGRYEDWREFEVGMRPAR